MSPLHDRMPAILRPRVIVHWLDPSVTDPEELKPLLMQFPGEHMTCWPVGNVRNQGEGLLEPVDS